LVDLVLIVFGLVQKPCGSSIDNLRATGRIGSGVSQETIIVIGVGIRQVVDCGVEAGNFAAPAASRPSAAIEFLPNNSQQDHLAT
jgi:hypothetical protein